MGSQKIPEILKYSKSRGKAFEFYFNLPLGGGSKRPPHLFFEDISKTIRARSAIFWHTCRKMMNTSNKKIIFEIGQNLEEPRRLKHKLRISKM